MSEKAWLLVRQPNDLFACFVASEARLIATDMTYADAVAFLCERLDVPASIAPEKVHNACAAGMRRWAIVQRAIAAHRACQGVH